MSDTQKIRVRFIVAGRVELYNVGVAVACHTPAGQDRISNSGCKVVDVPSAFSQPVSSFAYDRISDLYRANVIEHHQEIGRNDDRDAPKWIGDQQAVISTHDDTSPAGYRRFEHVIVLGITADGDASLRHYEFPAKVDQCQHRRDIIRRDAVLVSNARPAQNIDQFRQ